MSTPLQVTFTPERQAYETLSIVQYRLYGKPIRFLFLGIASVCLVLSALGGWLRYPPVACILVALIGIACVVLEHRFAANRGRVLFARQTDPAESAYLLEPDHMLIRRGKQQGLLPYTSFLKVVETRRYIFFFSDKQNAHILPKYKLGIDEYEWLGGLLQDARGAKPDYIPV